jgi:hypothetical protein
MAILAECARTSAGVMAGLAECVSVSTGAIAGLTRLAVRVRANAVVGLARKKS